MKQGMIQVYTGDGKGKTTAAFGLALRAWGVGLKIYIGQFMKYRECSELNAFERFSPNIIIAQFGRRRFIQENVFKEDVQCAQKGFDRLVDVIYSQEYDLVILDELNVALHFGLIKEGHVLDLLNNKPKSVELVLTGRYATDAIMEKADLVTEMQAKKHYFNEGLEARLGIEK